MSGFQEARVDDIAVAADRLRPVRADYAAVYSGALLAGRELPPIKVRRTPNGKKKFALVAGAHRLEAHRLAGREMIAVQVIAADGDAARAEEIEENLLRYELTALERIDAVAEYRRLFEKRHGRIAAGNPTFSNSARLAELSLLGHAEGSEQGSFFAGVTERLGLSRRVAERFSSIAKRLTGDLHDALRASTAEDNAGWIERLSALPAGDQIKLAKLVAAENGDVGAAEATLFGRPPAADAQRRREAIGNRIGAMSTRDRRSLFSHLAATYADDMHWALAHIEKEHAR